MIIVKPLLPPPPQFGARLQPQHLHWQVGRYKERLSSGPGGLGRGRIWVPEQEAEQHNLILTQTYDSLIPAYGFAGVYNPGLLAGLVYYAVVGTGSTPPASSQTGLVNEVARTNAAVSAQPDEVNRLSTSGSGVGTVDLTVYREFTEAQVGGKNLTEWGFSPVGTAGGNLMCRELFRDGSSSPVVLSLATDQRLRLIYKYRFSYTPHAGAPQSASINISGLGTFTGKVFASSYINFYSYDMGIGDVALLSNWAVGLNSLYAYPLSSYFAPSLNAMLASYNPSPPDVKQLGVSNYQAITRGMKILPVTWGASESNRDIYGPAIVRYTYGGYIVGGVALAFDSGVSFTKSNLYKLQFDQWTLTWGP